MTIGPAKLEDMEGISRLYKALNTDMSRLQPEMFRPAGEDGGFIRSVLESERDDLLLAREDGRVLGLALVQDKDTPPYSAFIQRRYTYLMDLVVAPEHRGRGIGRALLGAVKDWAESRDAEFIELGVLAQNEDAIRLYESLGFKDSRKIMQLDL